MVPPLISSFLARARAVTHRTKADLRGDTAAPRRETSATLQQDTAVIFAVPYDI